VNDVEPSCVGESDDVLAVSACGVGALDGFDDGTLDGFEDGALDGFDDGALDGFDDGALDGFDDGALDGFDDGAGVVSGEPVYTARNNEAPAARAICGDAVIAGKLTLLPVTVPALLPGMLIHCVPVHSAS
jgi:hypothetical protein